MNDEVRFAADHTSLELRAAGMEALLEPEMECARDWRLPTAR